MDKDLASGSILSHYRIVSKLGEGGMGEVWLAEDTRLGRKVALKLLPSELTQDSERVRRFTQEAKAASALNHPNIISVYDIGESEIGRFIVMEFVAGRTLRTVIAKDNSLGNFFTLGSQMAQALSSAHAAGITHRDIKPDNIMVRDDGYVKMLDFGLARLLPTTASDPEAMTLAQQTTPGTVIGTLAYMSPEQASGQPVGCPSDVFALGIVLYELATGSHPFKSETMIGYLHAITSQTPPPMTSIKSHLPVALDDLILSMLEKDAGSRPTATEVVQTLQEIEKYGSSNTLPLRVVADKPKVSGAEVGTDGISDSASISNDANSTKLISPPNSSAIETSVLPHRTNAGMRRYVTIPAALVLVAFLAAAYLFYFRAPNTPTSEIKSLAVLPLKSLDGGENYLGLGIADAAIRRISQTGKVIVRPTSAVRRYLNEDTDALSAAKQLGVDSVLEGSLQRAGDRLRVSVNLLRSSDGTSLWTEKFDLAMTDIFTIQDTVAQQVAARLRLQLDPSQQAQLTKRYTSNAIAYELYLKGVYAFDQRVSSKEPLEASIGFFKQATEADPNFALAHAQLAYAYAAMAVFLDPTQPAWAQRAREATTRAQELDPQLAETHLARFQLLYSQFEGYQGEAAVREVRLANQLNSNIGHGELAFLYSHLGLVDLAGRELERAREIDPTSEFNKAMTLLMYEVGCKYDEYDATRNLFRDDGSETWYLMGKGRLNEAQKALEEWSAKNAADIQLPAKKALLLALKGDFRAAETEIPIILGRHPTKEPYYHHAAYDIACIYALQGRSTEAVKWLREAAFTGYQPYPRYERDAYLNRIRQAPEFIQFVGEMKSLNEKYRREFANDPT